MESVVRLIPKDGKVLIEGIFGESREVEGTLGEVDIISQTANVIRDQPTPIMNPIKRILPSFRKA